MPLGGRRVGERFGLRFLHQFGGSERQSATKWLSLYYVRRETGTELSLRDPDFLANDR